MSIEDKYNHILEILEIFDGRDLKNDYLFGWRDGDNARYSLNCNDYFYWGCADGEDIEIGDIPLLKQSIEDCIREYPSDNEITREVYGFELGTMLFICRKRKERPQGCCYPKQKELWHLFDAAGPEREVGLGNPYKPGQRSQAVEIYNKKLNTRIKKSWKLLKEAWQTLRGK